MPTGRRLRLLQRGDPIPASWLNELAASVVQRMTGGRGIQIGRVGTNITISLKGDPTPMGTIIRKFRITGSTQDGSNKRWTYQGTEIVKTGTGYSAWGDKPGGLTGVTLYSLIESTQTGAVTAGGVDTSVSDFPAGVSAQPLQAGARVFATQIAVPNADPEWWIVGLHTQFSGTCD